MNLNVLLILILLIVAVAIIFVMYAVDEDDNISDYLDESPFSSQLSDKDAIEVEHSDSDSSPEKNRKSPMKILKETVMSVVIEQEPDEDEKSETSDASGKEENNEEFTGSQEELEDDAPIYIEEPEERLISAEPLKTVSHPALLETGGEEDMALQMNLFETIAPPSGISEIEGIALIIQFRFPREEFDNTETLAVLLKKAEEVFFTPLPFEFTSSLSSHLDRLLIFTETPGDIKGRDNPLFEALVTAYEVIRRFRQLLTSEKLLTDAKVKIAAGVAKGPILALQRGFSNSIQWFGKTVYLAETLAEVASDFSIYVDTDIYRETLPLFNFREWKPVMLRQTMPPLPIYELVGWNNVKDIASYASDSDPNVRRMVAVAYRYLELPGMQPLIELLSDKVPAVLEEALKTAVDIASPSVMPLLKKIMPEQKDPAIRAGIIDAIAAAKPIDMTPLLLASLREADWRVRLAAVKALYAVSGKNAVQYIEPMLQDPDNAVRVAVNRILYEETKKQGFFDNLVDFLGDLSRRTSLLAADALLSYDTEASIREIATAFPKMDEAIQKHILRKLEKSKVKNLYKIYVTLFKRSGDNIRPYIVEAVKRSGLG